jgi:hypothetical protein
LARSQLWCCISLHHHRRQPHSSLQQHLTNTSPQASPLVARPHVSSSPPRLLASPPHLPAVSRSLTDISLVPSLSVRSVATRSRLSSSSASSPSSAWFVRSPRTSSPTCASSHPPSVLYRSLLRLTSSPSLRTPTCALSTPSVSPSVSHSTILNHYFICLQYLQSPRTFSSLVAFVVSAPRCF